MENNFELNKIFDLKTKKITYTGRMILDDLDESSLSDEKKQELDDLMYSIIDQGYQIRNDSPKFIKQFKYIKYAIEQGQFNDLLNILVEILNSNTNIQFDQNFSMLLLKKIKENNYNDLFFSLNFKDIIFLLNLIDNDLINDELRKIKEDSDDIIKKYGKINVATKNPVFTYHLVKHIYPKFGVDFCIKLLKYNSGAYEQIIKQIDNLELLKKYYNSIVPKLFNMDDDKTIHIAFRFFDTFSTLIKEIIDNNYNLSAENIKNLRKIILNSNMYDIKKYSELNNYKNIINARINSFIESNNINMIKSLLASIFGYQTFKDLKTDFEGFQLDNFNKLNYIYTSIKNSNSSDKLKDLELTDYEKKIIIMLKEIIETSDIELLKDILKNNINNEKELFDYTEEINDIITKIRKIYNIQFQTKLTDLSDIKSKKSTHSKNIKKFDGLDDLEGHIENVEYEIIDMESEKFYFLAHRIYNYDIEMKEYSEMLMKNPSLWTKLDGASTLSTSSISDKGFWMLHPEDNNGVIFLFNILTNNFMLYMYGADLSAQHGINILEPEKNNNHYTDIDCLNQSSAYHSCSYNEVTGFREGMMPCAIACVGEEPTDNQIRAANFFGIPIIRFNIKKYQKQNAEKYKKKKEKLKEEITIETIEEIFLSGDTGSISKTIKDNYEYCFNIIKDKYQKREISKEELIQYMIHIRSLIDRIYDNNNEKENRIIKKIELFIETFCCIQQISEEEIIELEIADSKSITFEYSINGVEYVLKPAIDEPNLKNQKFKAEIKKAASKLQQIISEDTYIDVEVIGNDEIKISKQEKIKVGPNANALKDWIKNGNSLDPHYYSQLLKQYVIDFLLCNFNCSYKKLIIDINNNIRTIDKEESFIYIDSPEALNPDFSYIPNSNCGTPIYNILFDRYLKGEIDLDFNTVIDAIEKVRRIPDSEYIEIFRKYAESINPKNPDYLLNKILKRKKQCTEILEEFIKNLQQKKGGHTL